MDTRLYSQAHPVNFQQLHLQHKRVLNLQQVFRNLGPGVDHTGASKPTLVLEVSGVVLTGDRNVIRRRCPLNDIGYALSECIVLGKR